MFSSSVDAYHNFCIALENAIAQKNLNPAELWYVSMRHEPPLFWDDSDDDYKIIVAHLATNNSPLIKKSQGDSFSLDFNVWVTLLPQIKSFWKTFEVSHPNYRGTTLKRIQQYMGFPLDFITPYCVEMSVRQSDLFRPCNNPKVEYISDPRNPIIDPHFPFDLNKHEKFMKEAETLYYPDGEGEPLFPFTKLGYTYDWYDLTHPVGASEFVIHKGAQVKIHSVQSIDEYLA